MHYEAHFIHNGWELVILSFLMVNNKDIYVITEPTEELLCVCGVVVFDRGQSL